MVKQMLDITPETSAREIYEAWDAEAKPKPRTTIQGKASLPNRPRNEKLTGGQLRELIRVSIGRLTEDNTPDGVVLTEDEVLDLPFMTVFEKAARRVNQSDRTPLWRVIDKVHALVWADKDPNDPLSDEQVEQLSRYQAAVARGESLGRRQVDLNKAIATADPEDRRYFKNLARAVHTHGAYTDFVRQFHAEFGPWHYRPTVDDDGNPVSYGSNEQVVTDEEPENQFGTLSEAVADFAAGASSDEPS